MDWTAQRSERCFKEGLALGRVGVNRPGNVLEPRAHFEGQAEFRRQLRNSGPHRLDAKHEVIVGPGDDADEASFAATAVGVKLAALTPSLRRRSHVPDRVDGVLVRAIADSSPLADADLQVGDVIVSINQKSVTTPEAAVTMLGDAVSGPDKRVLLQINRRGVNEYVAWSEQTGSG